MSFMAQWTLEEIVEATGGRLYYGDPKTVASGVSFDTRTIKENNVFVPMVADRNGHEFIQSAIDNGASVAFWSDPIETAPQSIAIIEVTDTLVAFQQFAQAYLKKIKPKVVAITGSNGKTTTKDMVAAVASSTFKTHKTVGNFNNHIGLPLTILEMGEDTEVIVLEMGMSGRDEISLLSKIAKPDISVITMIGESHIEFLGSREGIADAKFEIIDGMQGGTLIYPGEEPLLSKKVIGPSVSKHVGTIKTFGKQEGNDLYPLIIEPSIRSTQFTTNRDDQLSCTLPIPGVYNVQNALAAILVGEELGIDYETAYHSLTHFELTKNRLEWKKGWNDSVLLNDAYNASPSSMKAALNYFQQIDVVGKKIVVLGDILELGEFAKEMHVSLHKAIHPDAIDLLVLYGKDMTYLYEEMTKHMSTDRLFHFEGDKEPLIQFLKDSIQPNDTVLLKSSRSTGLLEVVSELSQSEKG